MPWSGPRHRPHRARGRRWPALPLLFLCFAVWFAPTPARADTDPETQRQQSEQRKKDIAQQLDVLHASDDQLKAELDKLDVGVKDSEAKAAQARADLDATRAQLGELERQVVDAQQAAALARRNAADRAVEAYMRPDRETATQVLAAKDPQQLAKMHLFMTDLAQFNHDVVLARVQAEQDLTFKQNAAQAVHDRADQLAADADRDVADATQLRDQRVVVRAELDHRIGDLQDESAALDAQEARLTALIEARSQQVKADPTANGGAGGPATTVAPTTTSTTSAPTTTSPGPTTTAKPGTPTTKPPPTTAPPTTSPPTTRPPGAPKLSWPVSGPVTSPFGARWGTFHKGIDIGVPEGTPIHAAASGTVFFSGVIDGYGNVILIDHGNGLVTLYAHQSQLIATQGQYVTTGQTIGLVGSTGHSTGPHLHFEVRVNNVAVDPMGYLP